MATLPAGGRRKNWGQALQENYIFAQFGTPVGYGASGRIDYRSCEAEGIRASAERARSAAPTETSLAKLCYYIFAVRTFLCHNSDIMVGCRYQITIVAVHIGLIDLQR